MTQSVAQVSEITQQVAASAEESASAARKVGHGAEFRRTGAGR